MLVLDTLEKRTEETVQEYVYRTLRQSIMTLSLAPGTALSESLVTEELSVSRTPVREAMAALKNENLLETIPHRATLVAPIHMQYVREGYYLRSLVEPAIFRQIAGTLDTFFVRAFEKNLKEQAQAISSGRLFRFHQLDDAFHQILYTAARKENIWQSRKMVTGHYDRLRYLVLLEGTVDATQTYQDHRLLFTYLLTGLTKDAMALYQKHFSAYKEHIPALQEKLPHYFSLAKEAE